MAAQPLHHTIASYNVLHDGYRPPGWASWNEQNPQTGVTRWHQCLQNIQQIAPGILALQECDRGTYDGIKQQYGLEGVYANHWEGDAQGVRDKGEGVAILYTNRYQRLGVRSPTFQSPGQQGRVVDRAHIWTDLRDQQTGKVIRVASFHLFGGAQRQIGEQQIAQIRHDVETGRTRDQRYEVDMIALCGDFNGSHLPVPINGHQPDPRVTSCFQNYFFDRSDVPTEPATGRRIDYVFVRPVASEVTVVAPIQTDHMPPASDHHISASHVEIGHRLQQQPPMAEQPMDVYPPPMPQAPVAEPMGAQPMGAEPVDEHVVPMAPQPAFEPAEVEETQEQPANSLKALATRVYDLVWNQKYTIGFSLIAFIFAGLKIAVGVAMLTAFAQYVITQISPSCEEEVSQENI